MTRSRDEIELDLPFAVNGTLSETERAEFDAQIAEDAQLRAEFDALCAIREGMQGEEHRGPGEFGLARLMRDVDRPGTAASPIRNRPWVWQAVAALAVAGFLGQAFWNGGDVPTNASYDLASAVSSAEAVLIVGFRPAASEAAIRAVLLDAGVEIVGGPSALGLYRLAPADGVAPQDAAAILRAAADIVESIEDALD